MSYSWKPLSPEASTFPHTHTHNILREHREPSAHLCTNKPFKTLYVGLSRSNLGQLKCVRSPGVIGAISAIKIEYIISVYPLLQHHRVGNNILFTQYFVHEIIASSITFAGWNLPKVKYTYNHKYSL